MKYVCYKKTISKVADENIQDVETIQSLLKCIHQSEHTCSLRMQSGIYYDQVRITHLNEDNFQYVVFSSNAKLHKVSAYLDIAYLEVVTVDNIISGLKPNVDRWDLLDAEDMDDAN